MNKKKLFLLAVLLFVIIPVLLIISLNSPPLFTDPYYYIPWHVLVDPPMFCEVQFEDPLLPSAPEKMHIATQNAIDDWKLKLVKSTGYVEGWNFKLESITQEEYYSGFLGDCTVFILFERYPAILEEVFFEGYAFQIFGFSDITIFYLEDKYDIDEMIQIVNDNNFKEQNLSELYDNQISSNVESVLKHEIGHSFGLDHPIMKIPYKQNEFDISISNSIMITPEIYPYLPYNLKYEITDYDIKSVVNLYGENGIDEYEFYALLGLVFIGIIMWILAMIIFVIYLIIKKLRGMKSDNHHSLFPEDFTMDPSKIIDKTIPLSSHDSTNNPKSKKCLNCGRVLLNYTGNRPCINCGNLV